MYSWVQTNRHHYKKMKAGKRPCNMTPERAELLEQIGFVWDAQEAAWMSRYRELCDFRRENGHW